jgi:CBS domain-containing protein
MQRISEVMTREVQSISPQETLQRAAQLMDELNVGSLPVCDNNRVVGIVTDRDLTIRATSSGQAPDQAKVQDVMSTDIRTCYEDEEVDKVMEQMSDVQIRRIPVLDRNSNQLVGIVSLGDLATKHSAQVDQTLEGISKPSQPDLPLS